MAFVTCKFFSQSLQLAREFWAVVPEPPPSGPVPVRYPVVFLLHGLSDDHTIWQRRTSVERYAQERGLAVVMPGVDRSFYLNMASGPRYGDYISEEIPRVARALLPLSEDPAHTYVAGLSMGGYGAFKLALDHPERYAAACSLSGAVDMGLRAPLLAADGLGEEMTRVFGDLASVRGGPHDLLHLAAGCRQAGRAVPRLLQLCGTEDFLYPDNQAFRHQALALGLPLTYREGPGTHEWGYWDKHLPAVLDWFLGREPAAPPS